MHSLNLPNIPQTKNHTSVGLDSFISIITTQSIGKILVAVGSLSPSNTLNSTLSPSVTLMSADIPVQ